jgi:uncharacterized damage-inducible protein DinB
MDLHSTLSEVLSNRYSANLARIHELAQPLSEHQFWSKPFPYGNSFGHLVLHLTGNLNYYIGAQIANTGYVRHRDLEFTDTTPRDKTAALKRLEDAIQMVTETVHSQSADDWAQPYSAANTNCSNHLDIVLQCAAHMQHHIGQMIYICYEWLRPTRQ